ncbi:hypothetical protein C1Y40_03853 [Mycobacterium talmoniae]|uniref:Uncharacterized protein n=1 Tax=Mycobacterium talmoniae TaxID=1858794 RepID=A0A2S8BH75_9MYCO|nr:hypothetical protein C1Y40_03853 [Mycobacterium talmoniae]
MAGVGGKPLLAVEHPAVTVPLRAGDEQAGIRAALRLGHRITRRDRPVEQGCQIAGLLLVGAEHCQDLGVARIRCLTAEYRRRPARPAQDLVEQRQPHLSVALPAEVGGQVRRPQALLLDPLLQRAQHRHGVGIRPVVGVQRHQVQRVDLRAHELLDPIQFALIVRLGFKVPHGAIMDYRLPPPVAFLRPDEEHESPCGLPGSWRPRYGCAARSPMRWSTSRGTRSRWWRWSPTWCGTANRSPGSRSTRSAGSPKAASCATG